MDLPVTPSFRLDGKRALVTGASSGIGQGCAIALGDAGAHVVAAARRAEKLAETVDAIVGRGGSAEAVTLDQAELDQLAPVLETGGFDIVLNAAGLARHGPALQTKPEDYDAVMSLNLRSAYFLSAWAAKAMIARGVPGSIIHISSQMGHVGGQERAVYCASKHGVEGLTKAMAIELGPHQVRISTHLLIPGFVFTELTARGRTEKPAGAWTPGETAAFMIESLSRGDFYILCPDNDVDRATDEKRMAWAIGDIIENRPALSRWHKDYADRFEAYMKE